MTAAPGVTKLKPIFITLLLSALAAPAATVNIPLDADIQAIVHANPPGTTFQFAAGVYRMQRILARDGDQFIGALDEAGNRLTILSGAQILVSFTRDEFGNYVASTTQTIAGQQVGFCAVGHPRCTYPEDLFYDDEPYLHSNVGGALLAPGQFYFHYPTGRIFFRPRNPAHDPNQHRIEYTRTRSAIFGTVSNLTIRNLIVEKYAVPAQAGAIGDQYPGEGWVVENNETRWNHGGGIRVSGHSRVVGNYTHHNGQLGLGGSGENILVEGNETAANNYLGIDHDFECGGFKFAASNGLIIRRNYSHDNIGPGMWTDISSIHVLYENNLVMNNSRSGIFHETSYDAVIRSNMLLYNGSLAPDDWFWNAALQLAASQNVEAYDNVIVVNSENNGNGIMLIQQNRNNEPCLYGPCRVINNFIHDNYVIVIGERWHGSSGGVQDYSGIGDMYAPGANNRFIGNHYFVNDLESKAYWHWKDFYQTFDQFRFLGLESQGSVNLNMTPPFRTSGISAR